MGVRLDPHMQYWNEYDQLKFVGCIFSILRFKFVISFVRSFGGTWYMYILASICDFCTYSI